METKLALRWGGWVGGGELVKKLVKKRKIVDGGTQTASQATSHHSTLHTHTALMSAFAVMCGVRWTKRGQVRVGDKNLFSSAAQKDSSFRSRKVEEKTQHPHVFLLI